MKKKVEQARDFMKAAVPVAKEAGMVGIGMLAAALVGKGVDKLGESFPGIVTALPWLKAGAMFIGGVGLSTYAAMKQEKPTDFNALKLVGYGVAGMGVVAAGKAITANIPGMENLLAGIDFNQLPTRFYSESLENIVKGAIGESNTQVNTENASAFDVTLPELSGASDESEEDHEATGGVNVGRVYQEVEAEDVEFSEVV